jgi:hypothetical protein
MTAVAPAPPASAAPASAPVRFGRLLLSEWTKLRSVRSTAASLGLLVVLTLGFTTLIIWLTVSQWDKADPSQQRQLMADPVSTILGSGFQLSQLTICVLGVLVITGEYATGMIRASLLAVPRRVPMLAAKAVVFAVLVFVVGELVAFPSFFIGAAILHAKAPVASAIRACCARWRAAGCTWPCWACSPWPSAAWSGIPPPRSRAWSASCSCWRRWPSCCPAASASTCTPTCRRRPAV